MSMFSDMSIPSLLPDQRAHYSRNVVANFSNESSRRNDEDISKEQEPSAVSKQPSRLNLDTSETSNIRIPTEQTPVGILGSGNQHRIYLWHLI